MKLQTLFLSTLLLVSCGMNKTSNHKDFIGKNTDIIKSDRMTPEVLWGMGRIGNFATSEKNQAVYGVTYYSVKQNKSHKVLYTMNIGQTDDPKMLTTDNDSEFDAVYYTVLDTLNAEKRPVSAPVQASSATKTPTICGYVR